MESNFIEALTLTKKILAEDQAIKELAENLRLLDPIDRMNVLTQTKLRCNKRQLSKIKIRSDNLNLILKDRHAVGWKVRPGSESENKPGFKESYLLIYKFASYSVDREDIVDFAEKVESTGIKGIEA